MKKGKKGLIFFEAGDIYEGYEVLEQHDSLCTGCAFRKRGEPCKSPKGWICSSIGNNGERKDVIFKKIENND